MTMDNNDVKAPTTRYGLCAGEYDWIVGYLLDRCPDHPDHLFLNGTHISSSEGWSEHDIRVFHHDKIGDGAEFVWLGHFTSQVEAEAAIPLPLCTKAMHSKNVDSEDSSERVDDNGS